MQKRTCFGMTTVQSVQVQYLCLEMY